MAGFFSRLFGGKPESYVPPYVLEQERQAAVKRQGGETANPTPEVPTGPKRLRSEACPVTRKTPEYKEVSRKVRFEQYKYGKRRQYEGGPIISGMEHANLGMSPGFGNTFDSLKTVRALMGADDLSLWHQYPWLKRGGGIVKANMVVDGKPTIVCGRYNAYQEEPSMPGSRYFHSAHLISVPAEDWSVAAVARLASMLDAEPPVERPGEMRQLEIDTAILDEPLSEGWMDDSVKELVMRVVTGKPLAIQQWDQSVKDFLGKLYLAEICLPEAVARQISFGSGVFAAREDLRVSHGMAAWGDQKRIGGVWKGDDKIDKGLSDEYLAELMPRLAECRTPRDVMRVVAELPADLVSKVERNFGVRSDG